VRNSDKQKKTLDEISIGDIYEFSAWTEADVHFYEVVKKTNSFVHLREIESEVVLLENVPEEKRSLGLVGRMDNSEDIYKRPMVGKYIDEKEFKRKMKRLESPDNPENPLCNFHYITHKTDGIKSFMLKIEKDDIWYRDKIHDKLYGANKRVIKARI